MTPSLSNTLLMFSPSERVREILLEMEGEAIEEPVTPERAIGGAIELRNVSFRYPSRPDVTVLADVSLAVPAGSSLALVGSSGAGKSTIVNLLLRFFDPAAGVIAIDGRDARDYPLHTVRSSIALVPQDITLFGGTIAENILYGNPDASQDDLHQAARLANALARSASPATSRSGTARAASPASSSARAFAIPAYSQGSSGAVSSSHIQRA